MWEANWAERRRPENWGSSVSQIRVGKIYTMDRIHSLGKGKRDSSSLGMERPKRADEERLSFR